MIASVLRATTIAAGLYAFAAQPAAAQPLRCSAELKVCITNCTKNAKRAAPPVCITNCRTRNSVCIHTGCWDNGTSRFCGLTRQ